MNDCRVLVKENLIESQGFTLTAFSINHIMETIDTAGLYSKAKTSIM